MITLDKAIKSVNKKFPSNEIYKIFDFIDFYVMVLTTNNKKETLLDSSIGVYKNNGKLFVFNPLNFDVKTLNSKKEIRRNNR